MNRRTALKNLIVLTAGSAAASTHRTERFYVAGARFYPPSERIRAGDHVALVPTTIRGEHAYAVEDAYGAQIGWVPRGIIRKVDANGIRNAKVVEVALRRVPWRWYRLMIA